MNGAERHKPESVYAVDAAGHVFSVIYVGGFGVENLKHSNSEVSTASCCNM